MFSTRFLIAHTISMLRMIVKGTYWYLPNPRVNRMMTSSNGNIFRVTGPLCGEFTGPGEFPTQRPVTRSFDVSVDLRLNKRLSKHTWGWWFETLSGPLWRHRNGFEHIAVLFDGLQLKWNEHLSRQSHEIETSQDPIIGCFTGSAMYAMFIDFYHSTSHEICARYCCTFMFWLHVHNRFLIDLRYYILRSFDMFRCLIILVQVRKPCWIWARCTSAVPQQNIAKRAVCIIVFKYIVYVSINIGG